MPELGSRGRKISPGTEVSAVTSSKINREQEMENPIVRLSIDKRQADFPDGEPCFFNGAIDNKHVSPTHFTDPGAEYCYRFPSCSLVLRGRNLPRKVRIHFDVLRGPATEEFHIIINNKEASRIATAPRQKKSVRLV